MEHIAYLCLLVSAFTVAFSLPVGRSFLALGTVLLAVHLIRERKRPVITSTAWLGFMFVVVAVVATVSGVNPSLGVPKLDKLFWFIAIPVSATLISSPRRLSLLLGGFAMGTGVLAVRTCVGRPIVALAAVRAGEAPDFVAALVNAGSMTDAQRLMTGIIVTMGFLFACRRERQRSSVWWVLLLLQCAALVLNFKRGSWICTCIMAGVFLAVKTNWKYLLLLAAVILSTLAAPPVRSRIADLKKEFEEGHGGRITMWTKVAPALIKKYPWGIGYRSLTNKMMKEIAPDIEPDRDHLHSNIAQILVATGWLGFMVYLAWMMKAVIDAGIFACRSRQGPVMAEMNAMVVLLVLIGLLVNGLVEYNFGDAELVLIYAFVIGCAAAGRMRVIPG